MFAALPTTPANTLLVEIIVVSLLPLFFVTGVVLIVRISGASGRRDVALSRTAGLIMGFFNLAVICLLELGILLNIGFGDVSSAQVVWKCIGALAIVMILTLGALAIQILGAADSSS